MNLLVVDWDFFTKVVERPEDSTFPGEWSFYDWDHDESQPFFFEHIWTGRAASFLRAGIDFPATSGEERDFWGRFKINPRAQLLYADSNMYAAHKRVHQFVDTVWLFDAHHDAGYHPGARARMILEEQVTCEDWMISYELAGKELHMRYPQWRDWALEGEPTPEFDLDRAVDDGSAPVLEFDRIFVCRSPAWTPPWLDEQFQQFIAAAPVARRISLDEMKPLREFDLADAQEIADLSAQVDAIATVDNETPAEVADS